jgi:hypothetical protein
LHSEGTIVNVIAGQGGAVDMQSTVSATDMQFTASLRALHMEAGLYNDRSASTWVSRTFFG